MIINRSFDDLVFSEALDVLEMAKGFGLPKFIIGGGYFRDKMLGIPWKDIDLFIPGKGLPQTDEPHSYGPQSAIEVTFEDLPVNVILLKARLTATQMLDRMDLGICQVGMSCFGQMRGTTAFWRDYENRRITQLYPIKTPYDADHAQRIKIKLSGFTYVPHPDSTFEPKILADFSRDEQELFDL